MSTVDNKAAVRRIYDDLWNAGNLAVADEIFVHAEGVKRYIHNFRAAFPDVHHAIDEMVAEGDTVVARWTAHGTHTGPWHNIAPTHQTVTFTGITIAHLVNGKIADHQTQWDTLALLEQLGVAPKIRKADGSRL